MQNGVFQTGNPRWSAVFSLFMGVMALIAAEFIPVSLLTPIARDLAVTEGMAGQTVTAVGVFAVLTSLLLAPLTGNIDRRRILLAFSAMLAASYMLIGIAPTYPIMLIGRAILGICVGGFWSLASAVTLQLVPTKDVPRALSIVYAGVSVATIIALPVASWIGHLIGWRNVFFLGALMAAIGFVWQYRALPSLPARAGREGGQGAVLPDEPDSGHERAEEKDISPADQMADPARHGQGDDRRYGNPGVDDAQGAGNVLRGDELQGDGGGQRPEAAHADAEYRAPDEHDRIGRSDADQHVGCGKHGGKSQQDAPPVDVSRQRGQQEAGQHGEYAHGGDRLPSHALGDGKISGNGRQQAYGDEFGCNQGHDAHKQGKDRRPAGIAGLKDTVLHTMPFGMRAGTSTGPRPPRNVISGFS